MFVCSLACNSSVLPLWPATTFQSYHYTAKPILQISILKQRFFFFYGPIAGLVQFLVLLNLICAQFFFFFRMCAKAFMLAITDSDFKDRVLSKW